MTSKFVRFSIIAITAGVSVFLIACGVQQSKSYYVTIKEMHSFGDKIYTVNLRVSGTIKQGSIHQSGTIVSFRLIPGNSHEQEQQFLDVSYHADEVPLPVLKDNAQVLVMGKYGKDEVFHAHGIQTRCPSRYVALSHS